MFKNRVRKCVWGNTYLSNLKWWILSLQTVTSNSMKRGLCKSASRDGSGNCLFSRRLFSPRSSCQSAGSLTLLLPVWVIPWGVLVEDQIQERIISSIYVFPQLPAWMFFRWLDPPENFIPLLQVADTMQLCPLGSGHFSLFLSFRLWVVVPLTFGIFLHSAFIESFNHFQSLLYKITQT